MGIDERTRHQLFLRLENVLGPEEATTLMEHLPPVGWADVVTKHDLDIKLEALEFRLLAGFRAELNKQMRNFMVMSSATAIGVGGLVLAAARLV
jgi:hypothetical protein